MADSELRLYRLALEVSAPVNTVSRQSCLVVAESPAAAAALAVERAKDRWETEGVRVLRCWRYPPGELALMGADHLEMVGTPIEVVEVADVG